jgi:hypothetical protein
VLGGTPKVPRKSVARGNSHNRVIEKEMVLPSQSKVPSMMNQKIKN